VRNLRVNRDRLSNPYDLHMTLKHILELSGRVVNSSQALSCPKCQSIFKELPWNRSCVDASIEQHWCTCSPYKIIDKRQNVVNQAVEFAVDSINKELDEKLCAHLQVMTIVQAKQSEAMNVNLTSQYSDYLLMFEVAPSNARFEATVRHHQLTGTFELSGSVSRLNEYSTQSSCVQKDNVKKYCFCLHQKN